MKIKVCEIFESIQGEGRFVGVPMLFIRLSGCNRRCEFCDTKFAWEEGEWMEIKDLIKIIKKSKLDIVLWTGGEPLLQFEAIREVIKKTNFKRHYLETNGDLFEIEMAKYFDWITFSPKTLKTAKKIAKLGYDWDIKIVTDLEKVNLNLIPYATYLIPLTTFDEKKDSKIYKKVWKYCVENGINFCPRLQILIWGKKRKI